MKHLSIDIETRSGTDIKTAGAYRYAQDPDFKILLFAYKVDDQETKVVDLASGEEIPLSIRRALYSGSVRKHAYNAAFEWWCLNCAGIDTPINQWSCTMVHAMYCGFPSGLAATGAAVGLPIEKQKLTTGSALIRYFCNPQDGQKRFHDPADDPDRWALFKEYNVQDVEAEYAILQKLSDQPMPAREIELWHKDVLMNALGVRIDRQMIRGALSIDADCRAELLEEARGLTGLENPNSLAQLIGWLNSRGLYPADLKKATVSDLLKRELPEDVRRVLEIRKQLGKTSVKKYAAMEAAAGEDDRIRGLIQFYGSGRAGRYAGRIVQPQNLPRNYIHTLDEARSLVKRGDGAGLQLVYGDVQDTLSQLIRTAFIPSEGKKYVIADFSAIEARVIAWLAGETWVNEVFASHGKIYEATAAQMFDVPIGDIVKGRPEYALRQKGKVATLALGYQGGTPALVAMGALDSGLKEEELPDIVDRWRSANPHIVAMWAAVQRAAVRCVETCEPQRPEIAAPGGDIVFRREGDAMTVQLPVGRKLFYQGVFLEKDRFGKPAVHYYGVDNANKWTVLSTFGGKLTENIVQAVARDCLTESLKRIWAEGEDIVFHVHDEVIIDAPQELTVDHICELMGQPIDWAPGLVLKAAGFESSYYMKD